MQRLLKEIKEIFSKLMRARKATKYQRILVIDDNENNKRSYQQMLSKKSYSIVFPDNEQPIISLVRQKLPHLIILNTTLKGHKTVGLCKKLKTHRGDCFKMQ